MEALMERAFELVVVPRTDYSQIFWIVIFVNTKSSRRARAQICV